VRRKEDLQSIALEEGQDLRQRFLVQLTIAQFPSRHRAHLVSPSSHEKSNIEK
jgi:hypothetical protein